MKQQSTKYLLLILLIAVLVTLAFIVSAYWNNIFHRQATPIACTMETKLCPDGSSVGRAGPKCEFSACPAEPNQTAGWKTYKSDIYNYEIKYPSEYKTSNSGPVQLTGVPGEDVTEYSNNNYFFNFIVFARNADFIVKDCLKDLSGNNIAETKEINGNRFYAFAKEKKGTGGRMALEEGAIQNEYRIIHNNYCYIIQYTVFPNIKTSSSPSQMETQTQFKTLDQIFSTFRFTDKNQNNTTCGPCGSGCVYNPQAASCSLPTGNFKCEIINSACTKVPL